DYPVIVVFGSYAKASDSKGSDIDLCIISSAKKSAAKEMLEDDLYNRKFEKALGRRVSIHAFTKEEFGRLREKDPAFASGVANGMVLSGELEVA
ncbi:MAG: nucleotidyltransferase domain-containing protein, partial [Candidatus Aenigmatarchaeota archaeon]